MSFTFNNGPLKRQTACPPTGGVVVQKAPCQLFLQHTPSSAQGFTSRDASKTSTLTAAHDGDSEAMGNSKQ